MCQARRAIFGRFAPNFSPLFDWTQEQKRTLRVRFLRREVLPRREAVLAIAQEIEEINASTIASHSSWLHRLLRRWRGQAANFQP